MPTDSPRPEKSGRFIEKDGALVECDADGKPLGVLHERLAQAEPAARPEPLKAGRSLFRKS